MANQDDKKPGDPFHSGHTVVLGEDGKPADQSGGGPPQQPGFQQPAQSQFRPTEWGAKTMALPPEAFDGLEGLPPGGPRGGGGGGRPGGGTHGGKTMAMPMDQAPQRSGPSGGGGGGGGGSVPYLETQAISPPSEGYPHQPAPSFAPGPPMEDEPVKTTLLDPSKIDMSAYGGGPAHQPPPQQWQPPQQPQQQWGPPPQQGSFDADGMAQGQKTVILRPEQAEQAIAQYQSAGAPAPQPVAMPPELKGRLVIFVPDTDPIIFDLMPGVTTVGRGMENHLVLGDPYASRKHMLITNRDGQYLFEDTGSDNGTNVNGQRTPTKTLMTGDVIEIGSVMMRFVMGDVRPEHQMRPSPSAQPGGGRAARPPRRAGKKTNKTQMMLLVFLVVATLALIAVMVVLFLQRQG